MAKQDRPDQPGRRRRWPLVLLAVVVVLGGLGALGWFVFLGGEAPERLTLSDQAGETGTGTAPAPGPGTISGTWKVAPGSVARYRIRETFAGAPSPVEAVGQTEGIVGQAVLQENGDQVTVSTASFEADLLRLESDRDRRDNAIKTRGIESQRFPKATFVLTQPVSAPRSGGTVQAVGDLTLHGVTKRVTIPLQTGVAGQQVELVGSLTFPFADFDMELPSIGGFVSVEDQATLEVKLLLAKQA